MNDNALIAPVIALIKSGLTANGFTSVAVKQSYQPTQQGAESGSAVYLHKLGDKRYGFTGRRDAYDVPNSQMVHTETQFYETMFQVNALSIQTPTDTASKTASDILNMVAAILQSDTAIASLRAQGIGILRVTGITNTIFVDDKDRHESSPSFDFTLTHEQAIVSTAEVVQTVEYTINRV